MTTFNDFEFNDRIRRENAMTGTNKNRMDGFTSQTDLKHIKVAINSIVTDFRRDGYEDEEIFEYLEEIFKDLILTKLGK